jgi:glutamate formiminotransferase
MSWETRSLFPPVSRWPWAALDELRFQVSINLVNFNVTLPHIAFEAVKEEAMTLDVRCRAAKLWIDARTDAMAGKYYRKCLPQTSDERNCRIRH